MLHIQGSFHHNRLPERLINAAGENATADLLLGHKEGVAFFLSFLKNKNSGVVLFEIESNRFQSSVPFKPLALFCSEECRLRNEKSY
jgi:hypothetical protein